MDNNEVISRVKKYLIKYKSVDIKWYINDMDNGLGINKNDREMDIIVQGVLSYPWFTEYSGHNKNDISIKYTHLSKWSCFIGLFGGAIGLIGGVLGIISFFCKS